MVTNKHYYTVVIGAAIFYFGTVAWCVYYGNYLVETLGSVGSGLITLILIGTALVGINMMLETVKPYERR